MDDAAGHVSSPGDRAVQCVHCEAGLHPIRDGVADDPARVGVLDRAEVELALAGGVFGDVGEPQLVRSGRGEVALSTDTVRAGLTYSALNNVGTLVSTAKSLMDVAPEGAAHYEQIINAYAIGAANAIARFQ